MLVDEAMRIIFSPILFLLINCHLLLAQSYPTIYLFPGQGSDERLFKHLNFQQGQEVVAIVLPVPERGMNMADYAKIVAQQIDTTKAYSFIGVSLGGMICTELAAILKPEKTIIISSAKSRKELPFRYRFQKYIPIYKIVPPKLLLMGAKFLQPIVEPDRKQEKKIFKSMLAAKDPIYMKRTVAMIINWKSASYNEQIIQIHGTKDHTIPIRHVQVHHIIKGGSHMMTLTEPEAVNKILGSHLYE